MPNERHRTMSERVHIPLGLRLMALVCRICPCCMITRRWPNSGFAKKSSKVQHHCPFCRSYQKVRQIIVQAESQRDEPVLVSREGDASEAQGGQTGG